MCTDIVIYSGEWLVFVGGSLFTEQTESLNWNLTAPELDRQKEAERRVKLF